MPLGHRHRALVLSHAATPACPLPRSTHNFEAVAARCRNRAWHRICVLGHAPPRPCTDPCVDWSADDPVPQSLIPPGAPPMEHMRGPQGWRMGFQHFPVVLNAEGTSGCTVQPGASPCAYRCRTLPLIGDLLLPATMLLAKTYPWSLLAPDEHLSHVLQACAFA